MKSHARSNLLPHRLNYSLLLLIQAPILALLIRVTLEMDQLITRVDPHLLLNHGTLSVQMTIFLSSICGMSVMLRSALCLSLVVTLLSIIGLWRKSPWTRTSTSMEASPSSAWRVTRSGCEPLSAPSEKPTTAPSVSGSAGTVDASVRSS